MNINWFEYFLLTSLTLYIIHIIKSKNLKNHFFYVIVNNFIIDYYQCFILSSNQLLSNASRIMISLHLFIAFGKAHEIVDGRWNVREVSMVGLLLVICSLMLVFSWTLNTRLRSFLFCITYLLWYDNIQSSTTHNFSRMLNLEPIMILKLLNLIQNILIGFFIFPCSFF